MQVMKHFTRSYCFGIVHDYYQSGTKDMRDLRSLEKCAKKLWAEQLIPGKFRMPRRRSLSEHLFKIQFLFLQGILQLTQRFCCV